MISQTAQYLDCVRRSRIHAPRARHVALRRAWLALALGAIALRSAPLEIETLDRVTITDPARGHMLEAKVRLPKTGGPYPVIVFSHSIDFDRNHAPELSEHWASHGYVVVHPSHVEKDLLAKVSPHARNPRIWFNRLRDMAVLLDTLERRETIDPRLRGRLDLSRLGVSGHSLGGHTSVLLGGATLFHAGAAQRFRDPRVRATMIVFPVEPDRYGLTPESWRSLEAPLLLLSGDREWQKWGFTHSVAGGPAKYHAVVAGASYFSFVNARSASSSPAIMAAARQLSVLFWDAHLKQDATAAEQLRVAPATLVDAAPTVISRK